MREKKEEAQNQVVKLQAENTRFLGIIKDENEKRMNFFNDCFEKDEQMKKEKEELKKEKELLSRQKLVIRGYLSKMTLGEQIDLSESRLTTELDGLSKSNYDGPGGSDEMNGFADICFKYDRGNSLTVHSKPITAMSLNTTGDILATASEDGYIKLTSLVSKKEVSSIFHQDRIALDVQFHS